MLSSWMSGVKQRTKPSGGMASPTIDANEEYYGYGSASPTEGVSDKDYRMRSAEHADKVIDIFIKLISFYIQKALNVKIYRNPPKCDI